MQLLYNGNENVERVPLSRQLFLACLRVCVESERIVEAAAGGVEAEILAIETGHESSTGAIGCQQSEERGGAVIAKRLEKRRSHH